MIFLILYFSCQKSTATPNNQVNETSTNSTDIQMSNSVDAMVEADTDELVVEEDATNYDKRLCAGISSACVCEQERCLPEFVFGVTPLSKELQSEMTGVTWHKGCPVPLSELSLVTLLHWNDKGGLALGELVVATSVAESLFTVFEVAYKESFPFTSVKRMVHFDGSDDKSMAVNNTSGFNCRNIKGTKRYSEHSYGKAIDINPFQNPWVLRKRVDPPKAKKYAKRDHSEPGMLFSEHSVVKAFESIGWAWGGEWKNSKDYQHFSVSGR